MRFDDDAPTPPTDATDDPAPRSRRRSSRPWSNPTSTAGRGSTGFDRPPSDADWAAQPSLGRPRPPAAPPVPPPPGGPDAGPADLAQVLARLTAMQSQITALQAAATVPSPPSSSSVVTGEELTAAIEALGTALGGGMATLLTEHRNLLARDLSTAADRILEEVGVRLRAATTQSIDGIEERTRHVVGRALTELSEQVDLRLDKVAADVAGLRAVMLEIPDQTAVTDRLDQLADDLAGARTKDAARMSPALAGVVETTVATSMEQIEEQVAGALETLTKEVQALRRRISLRTQAPAEDLDLDDLAERLAPLLQDPPHVAEDEAPDDEPEEEPEEEPELQIEVAAPTRATRAAKATKATKAVKATKATRAAKPAVPARGRRSRRIPED